MAYTWGEAGLISERFSPGQSGGYSYWYHFGPQGETRYLSNSAGIPTHPYVYTAYGVQLATLNATNPFKYGGQAGYYTSGAATSTYQPLILCGARWYDPELGRFLSRDPIGYDGGPNLFEYCGSNPVGGIDPSGLDRNGNIFQYIFSRDYVSDFGNFALGEAKGAGNFATGTLSFGHWQPFSAGDSEMQGAGMPVGYGLTFVATILSPLGKSAAPPSVAALGAYKFALGLTEHGLAESAKARSCLTYLSEEVPGTMASSWKGITALIQGAKEIHLFRKGLTIAGFIQHFVRDSQRFQKITTNREIWYLITHPNTWIRLRFP